MPCPCPPTAKRPERRLALLGLLATVCLLGACQSTGPKLDTNTFPLPAAYRSVPGMGNIATADSTDAMRGDWWTQYGSEELNRLVDRSLAHNADLRVATLQVAQAKIRADQARGGRLPTITAPIRAVVQSQGTASDSQQNSQAALAGAFRLDVWGEQRALVDSADMQFSRAVHERENVQRNTIGSLVSAYIAYLSVSDSILIAHENEVVATEILRSVEQRLALGDATLNELEQQRAAVFSQQVVMPGLENQQEDLRNTISRLVGALPGNFVLSEKGLDELRLPVVRTGLPSALLLGRPDIRMMESRMRAANANIDVAHARLLPPIDLTSQLGYSGATLASLLQPQNFIANTAAALAVSIFDGGVKKGEKAFAQSYYEEMVETYGRTVLQAIRDVESALASLSASGRRLEAQKSVTRSALNIFKIGSDAYSVGAIDQATLLESRKNYQRSADETQRAKADLLRGHSTLAYALGMGSVLGNGLPSTESVETLKSTNPCDVRWGSVGDKKSALESLSGPSSTTKTWEVNLNGMVHSSTILPIWRDLNHRFAQEVVGAVLHANCQWGADDVPGQDNSWFRLAVSNFASEDAAVSFCAKLANEYQACNVGSPSTLRAEKASGLLF